MEIFEIKKVCFVKGNVLYPTWKSNMQLISTDKGEFIDNAPGLGPFDAKWKDLGASPGFDWTTKLGEKVEGIIRKSRDYSWLNKY